MEIDPEGDQVPAWNVQTVERERERERERQTERDREVPLSN